MKNPREAGWEISMLSVRETFDVVPGFGVTYRIRRRTWLLFGLLPVMWSEQTERS